MARKGSTLQLSPVLDSIQLAMEDSSHRLEQTLSQAEACNLFLKIGALMHQLATRGEPSTLSPSRRKAAINLPVESAEVVTDANGQIMLVLGFRDFPTLRLHVPTKGAAETGAALLQASGAPLEARKASKPH